MVSEAGKKEEKKKKQFADTVIQVLLRSTNLTQSMAINSLVSING